MDEPIGDFPHTTKGEKNQVKAVACPSNSAQAGRAAQCEGKRQYTGLKITTCNHLQGCPGQALCRAAAGGVDPGISQLLCEGAFVSYFNICPDQEALSLRMNAIKHKILVLSGKGGRSSVS